MGRRTKEEEYSADAVLDSLDPRQHLLKRMTLVFGGVEGPLEEYSKQKNVCVREIMDNATDEVLEGHGDRIRLTFGQDRSFMVQDNGRGIPVDVGHDYEGREVSGIHLALGTLNSGGKFKTDSSRYSSGLNGLGGSAVIAVSSRADITVFRNNKAYSLSYKDWVPGWFEGTSGPDDPFMPSHDMTQLHVAPDKRSAAEKELFPTGTLITCWLNDAVFSSRHPYDAADIIDRAQGVAFLVPRIHIDVTDYFHPMTDPATGKTGPRVEHFHYRDGMDDLVALRRTGEPLNDVITIRTEGQYVEKNASVLDSRGHIVHKDVERRVPIEAAFQWNDGYDYSMSSYVNTINTKGGGVHETAFDKALVAAWTPKLLSMRGLINSKKEAPPIIDDYHEGLTAVLSVHISEPSFDGQSKERLGGAEVQKAITRALTDALSEWASSRSNSAAMGLIGQKVAAASRTRQAEKAKRDLKRRQHKISAESLPAKLADCERHDATSEVYICEGDSAAGGLKANRSAVNQAVFGIRGKIINALRHDVKRTLNNEEVHDIINILGAGFADNFDIARLRYHRVFFAVDADEDGRAIACLLFALFWKLFPDMVTENRIFKVETPLFIISSHSGGFGHVYAKDRAERDTIVADLDRRGIPYSMSRLKGLGEMEGATLRETALNPATRFVTQVTTTDVTKAQESLDLIFGPDTNVRKEWINSSDVDVEELT